MIYTCKIYFQQPTTAALMESVLWKCMDEWFSPQMLTISKKEMHLNFKTYWWLIIWWNPAPAPAPARFALQIWQNPAGAGFCKSKSGTALVTTTLYHHQKFKDYVLTSLSPRRKTVLVGNLLPACSNSFCRSEPNLSITRNRFSDPSWLWRPVAMNRGTPRNFTLWDDIHSDTYVYTYTYTSHSLSVPRHNLSSGSRAFRISAPKIWNSLPPHILQSQTLSSFRRHLKTH